MSERENNQAMYVSAPRSQGTNVITVANATYNAGQGLVCVLPLLTTVQVVNLMALFAPPADARDVAAMPNSLGVANGVTDAFLTLYADMGDAGITFSPSLAVALGANAPQLTGPTAVGSVSAAGIYTPGGAECWRLPACGGTNTGQPMRIKLSAMTPGSGDQFMSFIGTGTGFLRFYQSSPQIC
jgi:hypothetical protein